MDGDIKECEWGLNFSKDPTHVFNFYEPLGYNRYFKVKAYDQCVDSKFKSVTNIIEFVEEYDLMQFIEIIKGYDRTSSDVLGISDGLGINCGYGINICYGINAGAGLHYSLGINHGQGIDNGHGIEKGCGISYSYGINYGTGIDYSEGINRGYGINCGYGINNGRGINWGYGINGGSGIHNSLGIDNGCGISGGYGLREVKGANKSIFCYKKNGIAFYIFNKKSTEARCDEVLEKLSSFDWFPKWTNIYELKGNDECWKVCFPQLVEHDAKTAWNSMPKEMLEYIQSMPEYDDKIFKKITEMDI